MAFSIVTCMVFLCTYGVLSVNNYYKPYSQLVDFISRIDYDCAGTVDIKCQWIHQGSWTTIRSSETINNYAKYSARILLLSSDVELNPGQTTGNESPDENKELLTAILKNTTSLKNDLTDVKSNLGIVMSEVSSIRQEISQIKGNMTTIQDKQNEMESKFTNVEGQMRDIEDENHTLRLDIDELDILYQERCEMTNKLEDDMDRLEADYKRDTIRIFGLDEQPYETDENVKDVVINMVLKVSCQDYDWDVNDISRAYRVGKPKDDN